MSLHFLPVKTKDFAENKDQDHANEDPGLFHISTNTAVANNSNAVASGKTSHADCNTTSEMHKAPAIISIRIC